MMPELREDVRVSRNGYRVVCLVDVVVTCLADGSIHRDLRERTRWRRNDPTAELLEVATEVLDAGR